MPVRHTDSKEIFRYIDAAMAIARSCIYMLAALVEQVKELKSFTLALRSAALQYQPWTTGSVDA
jgi:hypothetical protein